MTLASIVIMIGSFWLSAKADELWTAAETADWESRRAGCFMSRLFYAASVVVAVLLFSSRGWSWSPLFLHGLVAVIGRLAIGVYAVWQGVVSGLSFIRTFGE